MEKYRTKLICTIGPATEDEKSLKRLFSKGMRVIRVNMSHGSYEEHYGKIKNARKISNKIGILVDTSGPEVRTAEVKESFKIKKGEQVIVKHAKKSYAGEQKVIGINFNQLHNEVSKGQTILIDDGILTLRVKEINNKEILCVARDSYVMEKSKRGVNVPGVNLSLPSITKKDQEDLKWACKVNADFVALSFVRTPKDVEKARKLLERNGGKDIKIIVKIEHQSAITNLKKLISISDGVMIARGDLAIEVPLEDVPLIQKEIIDECSRQAKPVIVATHMMESMVSSPVPTRAEISDVANSVFDGCDAIMTSKETTTGDYPFKTVEFMMKIAKKSNEFYQKSKVFNSHIISDSCVESFSRFAVEIAKSMNAKAIVCPTMRGWTARLISRHKPNCPIFAATPSEKVMRQLSISYNVFSHQVKGDPYTQTYIDKTLDHLKVDEKMKAGDTIILVGFRIENGQRTNLLEAKTL